ncbi:hypothetical protein Tco_0880935 [Tanacetum coccineum]
MGRSGIRIRGMLLQDQQHKIILCKTSTNEVNVVSGKTSIELLVDPNMSALEDYSIFDFTRDDEDDSAVADMKNLNTTIQANPLDKGSVRRASTIQSSKKV